MKICKIIDCDALVTTKGWCRRHYYSWWKYGDPLRAKPVNQRRICSIETCENTLKAKGFCQLHYDRWRRTGDPQPERDRLYTRGDRVCVMCTRTKPMDEFYTVTSQSTQKDGFQSHHSDTCKSCQMIEKNNQRNEEIKKSQAQTRITKAVRYYGEDARPLAEARENGACCEVCGGFTTISIDHCHSTGKVRGLLCVGCNSAIGHIKENIETLKGLIVYLQKHTLVSETEDFLDEESDKELI